MKTIEEIRDLLLDNAVDEEGNLNLIGLDFSGFDGDVLISEMKVKKNLYRHSCEVGGDLSQGWNVVKGNFGSNFNKVNGYFNSIDNKVGGEVIQTEPTKLFKEVTIEELEALGYKLKENK